MGHYNHRNRLMVHQPVFGLVIDQELLLNLHLHQDQVAAVCHLAYLNR